MHSEIHILTVSDDHYLPMLAALIKSVEHHVDKDTTVNFWVIDNGISRSGRQKLEMTPNADITRLHIRKSKDAFPKGTKLPIDRSTFPLNIYYRYAFPFFLPLDIKRLIYMDVDMINRRNLLELWKTDLGDCIIGAVNDPRIKNFECEWGGIRNYAALGLSPNNLYFNSGLLLIDVDRWRENQITERMLETINNNMDFAIYPDQYGLNVVLAKHWKQLDPQWNTFASSTSVSPYNIHFVDRKPIYGTYTNNPEYRQRFFHYLQQTPWEHYRPTGELSRYRKKVGNVLAKAWMRLVGRPQ